MATGSIYLDYAATTPLAPGVYAAMEPWLHGGHGNASSLHGAGRAAARAVEEARAQVAAAIGAEPAEIVFTSGGTESDNLAIKGVLQHPNRRGAHLVTTAVEHKAVLAAAHYVEAMGHPLTIVGVDPEGRVDPDAIAAAVTRSTALVSVMHANNEIGTIQPIDEIGPIVRRAGVLFHIDAVQTVGHLPVDVHALGCDLLSLSAHKFGGPKGVGALWVRDGAAGFVQLAPLLHGGFQEEGLRAGTLNTAGIVGCGAAAARLDADRLAEEVRRQTGLRDRLLDGIVAGTPGARVTGSRRSRLPGIASFALDRTDGEAVVVALDLRGIHASTGSACVTGQVDPSHVLTAIGLSRDAAKGALRLSLGEGTVDAEIERAIAEVADVVPRVRGR